MIWPTSNCVPSLDKWLDIEFISLYTWVMDTMSNCCLNIKMSSRKGISLKLWHRYIPFSQLTIVMESPKTWRDLHPHSISYDNRRLRDCSSTKVLDPSPSPSLKVIEFFSFRKRTMPPPHRRGYPVPPHQKIPKELFCWSPPATLDVFLRHIFVVECVLRYQWHL